jgi:opacity protein-like surface antigen
MTVRRYIECLILQTAVLTVTAVSAFGGPDPGSGEGFVPPETGRIAENSISVIAKGHLTTGSHLFPTPNSPDPFARARTVEFTSFFGLGLEVKYRFPGSNVSIGLSTDYIKCTEARSIMASGRVTVPTENGFEVFPVEVTGYFNIPVTGGRFAVFIGGGVGMYFGSRDSSLAGVSAKSSSGKPGYGIHVLGGISFQFTPFFSLSAEMKFRDAQFETTNTFEQDRITYHDLVVPVSRTPFVSSVHVDGMVLQLGVAVSF